MIIILKDFIFVNVVLTRVKENRAFGECPDDLELSRSTEPGIVMRETLNRTSSITCDTILLRCFSDYSIIIVLFLILRQSLKK